MWCGDDGVSERERGLPWNSLIPVSLGFRLA